MLELVPHDIAHGGEAVARLDGKAYFIPGVLPGERVHAETVVERGSWARVRLVEVLERSAQRLDPPCPHFALCGGCTWQYAEYEEQLRWKQSIVCGQLNHLGRVEDPEVRETVAPGAPYHYRNRMDFSVAERAPALHERRSNHLVPLATCHILAPELADVFENLGDLDGVERITLRAGTRTGERLVAIDGEVPGRRRRSGTPAWSGTEAGPCSGSPGPDTSTRRSPASASG